MHPHDPQTAPSPTAKAVAHCGSGGPHLPRPHGRPRPHGPAVATTLRATPPQAPRMAPGPGQPRWPVGFQAAPPLHLTPQTATTAAAATVAHRSSGGGGGHRVGADTYLNEEKIEDKVATFGAKFQLYPTKESFNILNKSKFKFNKAPTRTYSTKS